MSLSALQLLAQFEQEVPVAPNDGMGMLVALPFLLLGAAATVLTLVYSLFWVWMLIECIRSEPDRHFWIWLLIVVPFPGAVVYAVVRYYPTLSDHSPTFLRSWSRGRELARLENAAEQIGNAHQFIQWGDALRDVGRWNQAEAAYGSALKKEPENLQALWGAALVAEHQDRSEEVLEFTRKILDKDPQYKFGDVSLAYGKALEKRHQPEEAREHFENHIKRWRHPEGLYRLACLCAEQGDPEDARSYLRAMLQDLNGSPPAIARKHGRWKSRARQFLRKMK